MQSKDQALKDRSQPRAGAAMTIALCILASMADGFDLQALGIVAPQFKSEFSMLPAQMGWIFSANSFGLLVGASLCGWASDVIGRRRALIGSMLVFGLFSLGTAFVRDPDWFVPIRFLCGIGLGGALATIIAIVAETGTGKNKAMQVTLVLASNPLGAASCGAVMTAFPDLHWRAIFHIGGWWPLLIALAMLLWLPAGVRHAPVAREERTAGPGRLRFMDALFYEGRTISTLLLWATFFFCLLIIYMMISWLPTLVIAQGYAPRDGSLVALMFPLGGAIGATVLGRSTGFISPRVVLITSFCGIAVAITALAFSTGSLALLIGMAAVAGFFVIGSQYVIYGLSPTYYPSRVRGTGVGAAVAVGRLGSIAGPAYAGVLLSLGLTSRDVLLSLVPGVALALVAAIWLANRPRADD